MKRNQYIFLGMVFIAIPSLVQAQTQPKDTTLNRTVVAVSYTHLTLPTNREV